MEKARVVIQPLIDRAKRNPRRIVFTDGEDEKILRTVHRLIDSKICIPVLIGNKERILAKGQKINKHSDEHNYLKDVEIIDPVDMSNDPEIVEEYWKLRRRRGLLKKEQDEG